MMNTKNLTENEKQCITQLYENFIVKKHIPSGNYVFFNMLQDSKIINPTNKELTKFYANAQKSLLKEEKTKPLRQQNLYLFEGKRKLTVVFRAKCDYLESFFKKIQESQKTITQILNT